MEQYNYPFHYPLSSQSQFQFQSHFPPPPLFNPAGNEEDDFIVDNPQLPPINPPQQGGEQDRPREQQDDNAQVTPAPPGSSSASRVCSLKGCGMILPEGYAYKMCEGCRVKHQGYSRVKRSKRRQEKIDAGVPLRSRGPNRPKPQLYRVNGQLSVDPKWEHLDRRLFPPRPITPPPQPPPPAPLPPMQKDGYRRKPLPPKDDGAIELHFVSVKICTIKGCYQPIPAEYEKKTCLDCQDRYKGYAVTKRAKRRALKRAKTEGDGACETSGSITIDEAGYVHNPDSHGMSGMSDEHEGDGSGPDEDDFDHEFRMEINRDIRDIRDIPIDPVIDEDEANPNTNPSGLPIIQPTLQNIMEPTTSSTLPIDSTKSIKSPRIVPSIITAQLSHPSPSLTPVQPSPLSAIQPNLVSNLSSRPDSGASPVDSAREGSTPIASAELNASRSEGSVVSISPTSSNQP